MASQGDVTQEIADKFAGKWKEIRNENVEDFFKEMGLNILLRKLATKAKPEVTITVNGGDIRIAFKTPIRAEETTYKLNEEVEVENHMKGKFLATTTYADGKLLVKQKPVAGNDSKPVETEREINEAGEMIATIRVGDVVCKRIFTKLP